MQQYLNAIALSLVRTDHSLAKRSLAADTIRDRLWLINGAHQAAALSISRGTMLASNVYHFPQPVIWPGNALNETVWESTADKQLICLSMGHAIWPFQSYTERGIFPSAETYLPQFFSSQVQYVKQAGELSRGVQYWALATAREQAGKLFLPLAQTKAEEWVMSHQFAHLQPWASDDQPIGATVKTVQPATSVGDAVVPCYTILANELGAKRYFLSFLQGYHNCYRSPYIHALLSQPSSPYRTDKITQLTDQCLVVGTATSLSIRLVERSIEALQPWRAISANQPTLSNVSALLALPNNRALVTDEKSGYLISSPIRRLDPFAQGQGHRQFSTALTLGKDRQICIRTQSGLHGLDPAQLWPHRIQKLLTTKTLHDLRVVGCNKVNYLWLTTHEGLSRLDPRTGKLLNFMVDLPIPHRLFLKKLLPLQASGSRVWVGTRAKGLLLADPTKGVSKQRGWWKHSGVWEGGLLLLLGGGLLWQLWRRIQQQQWRLQKQFQQQLAHNLHDELGALLVRASLQAEVLKNASPDNFLMADRLLGDLQMASQAMRDIAWNIDPHVNTLGSLLDRMQDHLAHTVTLTGQHVDFKTEGIVEYLQLPAQMRQHIYAIFKESITNFLRHARESTHLTIIFIQQPQHLVLIVQDNGRAILRTSRQGIGLRSMETRAQALQGHLEVGIQPEGGFRVNLTVPLVGA